MTDPSRLRATYSLGRPGIDERDVAALLRERFGVGGGLGELGSQQDRNFLVTTPGGRRVLKVFQAATDPALVRGQLAVMSALATHGIVAPEPLRGLDGEFVQEWTAADGTSHLVLLLTFVEGRQLVDVPYLSARTARGLATLGGSVCRVLAGVGFDAERVFQWDLRHSLDVVRDLAGVLPPERRTAVLAVAERAWAEVAEVADDLPWQLIHADITDDNVVVRDDPDGLPRAVGVIDFGDLTRSWRVGELAVLLASMLHHDHDDLGVLTAMADAFAAEAGLTAAERRALWPLVQLRAAVLVVSGWQQLAIDPGNDYARERGDHEWTVFEVAAGLPSAVMTTLLLGAPAVPAPLPAGRLLAVRGQPHPAVLSLAADSAVLDDGAWLGAGAEDRVIRAAAGDGVVVLPQGEFRLTRSTPGADPAHSAPYSLLAEFAGVRAFEVEAATTMVVASLGPDALDLAAGGGVLRLRGLAVAPGLRPGTPVGPGTLLGTAVAGPSCCRVTVALQGDATVPVPDFCPRDRAVGYAPLVAGTNTALGLPEPASPDVRATAHAEQRRRDAFLPDSTERYYREPPEFVRGWRSYLVDTAAGVHLDLVNNVTAIGHSHPALRAAVDGALRRLNTNSRFLYRLLADYSERLLATTWGTGYDSVLLVNSGTEAVDLALRLAKLATGRNQVITHREGYHGWSEASDAVTTSAYDNPNALATRPDWVSVAEAPNPYRGVHRGPEAGPAYLADFDRLLDGLTARDAAPAAVIMESILGNAGGVVPPAGYFAGITDALHRAGGLSIADEVQVGFGRTGDTFWAARAEGVEPDIIVCAKAMGNGFPLGAVITRSEISSVLGQAGMFFSTTGGSPAACAAGLAVLDVMEREDLMGNAREVGAHLRRGVDELAGRHPLVGAMHGRGLYQGIELVLDRESLAPAVADTALLCEALLGRGIVDQATSERQNVLKIKPPMTLSRADADWFLEVLDDLLGKEWK